MASCLIQRPFAMQRSVRPVVYPLMTKLQSMHLWYCPLRRLAVLYACAPYPLPKLVLRGGIPHSKQLSVAMAAACPQLTHLDLSYADNPDLQAEECDQQDDHSYGEAIKGLLALSGPQLLKLSVIGRSHNWPTDCFSALQRCTALTSLELEAGFWDPLGWRGDPLFLGELVYVFLLWGLGAEAEIPVRLEGGMDEHMGPRGISPGGACAAYVAKPVPDSAARHGKTPSTDRSLSGEMQSCCCRMLVCMLHNNQLA